MSDKEQLRVYLETRRIVEYKVVAEEGKTNLEEKVNSLIAIGFVPCNVGFSRSRGRDYHYQTMCRYDNSNTQQLLNTMVYIINK